MYVQISCLTFLLLYAIILLTDFNPSPAIETKEIILIIWVVSMLTEEIRQVFTVFFRMFCV